VWAFLPPAAADLPDRPPAGSILVLVLAEDRRAHRAAVMNRRNRAMQRSGKPIVTCDAKLVPGLQERPPRCFGCELRG
jgi:hypothetical protein